MPEQQRPATDRWGTLGKAQDLPKGKAGRRPVPIKDAQLLAAILDSLKDPVLFTDTEHVICYMNKAAIRYYSEGERLLGRSLLDCHNERSRQQIIEILAAMQSGEEEEERLITDDEKHRIYMRAVRDPEGRVLGYYERYEPPTK